MRVVVIGGTGHIGSYLTPQLVEAGYSTVSVSRSQRQPYVEHPAWSDVERVTLDRADDSFEANVAALKPDATIDLTCYTPESAQRLVTALKGRTEHLLHCGTIWVHGPATEVPTAENDDREPISDYGRQKAAIEKFLLNQTDVSCTVIHPGHLVGEGWVPLNPAGNFNPHVFADLAAGRTVHLPNLGRETLHHVHASDVGRCFVLALQNPDRSTGESFHCVSPAAVTLAGYAQTVAGWYGKPADIQFRPWPEWRTLVTEKEERTTWDHIARSPNCSIDKARRLLGYVPRYRSLEAIRESLFSPLFPS